MAYSYTEVLVYISSLPGLEGPTKSVDLGSYTNQKAVVLSKNEGNNSYQYYGRPFDKEEDDGELLFMQFSVCHCSSVFYVL